MKCPIIVITVAAFACTTSAFAAVPKKPAKHTTPNAVKGQGQLAGLNGQFGTVYSLKAGFNFSLVSARYDIASSVPPSGIYPGSDKKLIVIDFALKNSSPSDNWFGSLGLFTVVDQNGQLYQMGDADVVLKSQGVSTNPSLRPGQGIGQSASDPLEAVIEIPSEARIVKIMLNRPRLNSSDDTIRYYVAGATKAEAGENGDPKNVITPLPAEVRDPSDASGATALAEGKGTIGKALMSRFMQITVDSVAFAPDGTTFNGSGPEDGKKFAVATVTVSAPVGANGPKLYSPFDWTAGNDSALARLVDTDGEKYDPAGTRKAKRDEAIADGTSVAAGESYTYRIYWNVPKDVTLKKLVVSNSRGRQWAFDVSDVK